MEASGVADASWTFGVGTIAVRGICDYCDFKKGDAWQPRAAIVAAATTLLVIQEMFQEASDNLEFSKTTVIIEY